MIEQDFEGIMKIMKNVSDYITDEEELVSFIYDVSFPKWIYDEIPKLESDFLKTIWPEQRLLAAWVWRWANKFSFLFVYE